MNSDYYLNNIMGKEMIIDDIIFMNKLFAYLFLFFKKTIQGIISIIEEYLKARKSETFETIFFRSKLLKLGCSKKKVDDLLLLLTYLNKKKVSSHLRVCYIIVIIGLILTVISTLDFILFNAQAMYLFYVSIIGGLTGIVLNKRSLQNLKQQQKNRKVIWDSWIKKNNSLSSKLPKNTLSPKQTINDMFS